MYLMLSFFLVQINNYSLPTVESIIVDESHFYFYFNRLEDNKEIEIFKLRMVLYDREVSLL